MYRYHRYGTIGTVPTFSHLSVLFSDIGNRRLGELSLFYVKPPNKVRIRLWIRLRIKEKSIDLENMIWILGSGSRIQTCHTGYRVPSVVFISCVHRFCCPGVFKSMPPRSHRNCTYLRHSVASRMSIFFFGGGYRYWVFFSEVYNNFFIIVTQVFNWS